MPENTQNQSNLPSSPCRQNLTACTSVHLLRSAMARTRGAQSSSPSSRKRAAPKTPPKEPSSEPQASQPPPTDSQIPSGMAPEVLIRHPMLTQPPIEGNLDCRASHSTSSSVLMQPLSDFSPSSGLPSIAPEPTVIHFTIDGRHGILGARHIAEALRIPYEPASPEDYQSGLTFPERDSSYSVQRGIHTPISDEEGAPS
ncbi:hypothetical protein CK203_047046 [Vitis vinifera]|uniref:Uncharacterized protein n=1 Tax=Vitis vinifera TaxID=29760 RepID=A0A438FWN8_VITVI|nr:hypothetical protein CK203_047046 [Vitis vinifera]